MTQIRSSVFKIIEMQETNTKKSAGFFWENPLAQTIYDHKEGVLGLELIHDFLEFFKMDYTLSVFNHESNLKDPARKEDLAKKLGVTRPDPSKPLIFSIIGSIINGEQFEKLDKENLKLPTPERPSSGSNLFTKKEEIKPSNSSKTSQILTNFGEKDFDKKDDNVNAKTRNIPGFPDSKDDSKTSSKKTDSFESDTNKRTSKLPPMASSGSDTSINDEKEKKKLVEAQEKIKQMEHSIKSNTIGELSAKSNKDNSKEFSKDKKQESDDNEYEDEQFENVEEELFEGDDIDEDLFYKQDKNDKRLLTSSEDIIGASQSQGFDVSVDSLALEEYDYYEDADKFK